MENHYFSIIGALAQDHKSAWKTIDWGLETNIEILGKTAIFHLKSMTNRTKYYPWPKIDLRVLLSLTASSGGV